MSRQPEIVVLRPGDDAGEAARLLKAFFAEEGFSTPAAHIETNLHRMLDLDCCRVLVVKDGNAAVAVATLSLDFGIEFGWAAEIGDLYVVPQARGQGLARELVEACRGLALRMGATTLYVTVTAHGESLGLKRFYGRLGFSDDGRMFMGTDIGPDAP